MSPPADGGGLSRDGYVDATEPAPAEGRRAGRFAGDTHGDTLGANATVVLRRGPRPAAPPGPRGVAAVPPDRFYPGRPTGPSVSRSDSFFLAASLVLFGLLALGLALSLFL